MTDTPETLLTDMAGVVDEAAMFLMGRARRDPQERDVVERLRAILAKYDAYVESRETGG